MALIYKQLKTKEQLKEMARLQRLCLPADTLCHVEAEDCAFGTFDSGRMVAFAVVKKSKGYYNTAYLARVGVLEEYRGLGIQKKLIQLRERWARKKGVKHIITDTTNDNIPSMRSLMSCKYKPFWPSLREPWASSKAVYWKKEL